MKSSFIALASALGLAAASPLCSNNVVYVTITPTETVTCGGTVYTTVTQQTTVTVPAVSSVAAVVSQVPESSAAASSTTVVFSTLFVQPSPAPSSSSSSDSEDATYFPYFPNTTSTDAFAQSTFSFELAASSTAEAEVSTSAANAAAVSTPAASSMSSATSTSVASQTEQAASASTSALSGSLSGEATFYGGNVAGGMCSFTDYTIPSGVFGTALSDSNWDAAGNCGACISVTGPSGNSIKAMIVDQCPGCGTNHLDLFPDAFSALADQSEGIIDVSWSIVPCGISSPLQLHNKDGTSEFWFSMQVVNSNLPVSKLEVSTDGGSTWQATERQDYNFFENSSGFGTDSVDVRVTSETGETITVKDVGVASGSSVTAGSNFSA